MVHPLHVIHPSFSGGSKPPPYGWALVHPLCWHNSQIVVGVNPHRTDVPWSIRCMSYFCRERGPALVAKRIGCPIPCVVGNAARPAPHVARIVAGSSHSKCGRECGLSHSNLDVQTPTVRMGLGPSAACHPSELWRWEQTSMYGWARVPAKQGISPSALLA